MKIFFITILLLVICGTGSTQNKKLIDSLHFQLSLAKGDTSRIHVQIGLCYNYRLGNTDSSLFYGQLALKKSQEINYPTGQILALSFMGITTEQAGNLPKALEMLFKALEIAKSNKLDNLTSPALNGIGEIYVVLKNYPRALYYLHQQRRLYDNMEVNEGLGYALYGIGVVFEEMNQLDSALHYEMKALEFFRTIDREEPFVFKILGNIELKSGNRIKALEYYQKSLEIALYNNERRASATAYNKLASFYKLVNQPDSGIYYARKGLEDAQLIFHKKAILDAAVLLSGFYEPKDPAQSLHYLKIADVYKDSLFGTVNLQAIQTLITQDEEYQKQKESARIKFRNRLKQYSLIAGLGILLLIATILYRNNRQKQKTNRVLESTLDNLKSTQSQLIQSEKMASLGELTAGIAHEIQNPLNFVNNFSEVNKELLSELKDEIKKGNADEILAIANDIILNEEKIYHHGKRADAIVKGMLQHSRSSNGQKESTDINALTDEYLRLAYHGLRAKDNTFNASFKSDFDESIGKINIIPQDIGRVILNLITNAFYAAPLPPKGGFKNPQIKHEPTIWVSTKKVGDKVLISVKDNGPGIPQEILSKIFQPFFTTKPTGQGTGLGLSLSYDIVKAHGGEMKVETKEDEGSEFIIVLPVT